MVSMFTYPDVNTWEVRRTLDKLETTPLRGYLHLSCVLSTSCVFTSGYVNTETILHIFITKSRCCVGLSDKYLALLWWIGHDN